MKTTHSAAKPVTPAKTGPSRATIIILALMMAAVLAYVLYQIVGNITAPYTIVTAYPYEANDELTVSGYVIREEALFPNQSGGALDITRQEGERVGIGQSVATLYTDDSALSQSAQLAVLRSKEEQLQFSLKESSGLTSSIKLDGNIQSALFSMQKNLYQHHYTALEQNISEAQALIIKRDYAASGVTTEALEAQLKDIQDQIKTLEASQARNAKYIKAPASGLFSAVTDGYETTLTPALLETMTPSQLAGVSMDHSLASNVGKMIYGSTWYYAANMDEKTAAAYKPGTTVTLRFVKELDRNLTMTVHRVSDSENGQKLVVLSCEKYLPEVTLLRRLSANIIHESYSGIRVPTEALRVENGVRGVYCLVGMQTVFKPVDIVWQGNGFYLVAPSKKSDDTENTGSSRLRVGDSILITAEELYDGKVIH